MRIINPGEQRGVSAVVDPRRVAPTLPRVISDMPFGTKGRSATQPKDSAAGFAGTSRIVAGEYSPPPPPSLP